MNGWRATGVRPRDSITLLARNGTNLLDPPFAIQKVGGDCVLMNTDFAAGRWVDGDEIRQYFRHNLASYEVRCDAVFIDTPAGNLTRKVLKGALLELPVESVEVDLAAPRS